MPDESALAEGSEQQHHIGPKIDGWRAPTRIVSPRKRRVVVESDKPVPRQAHRDFTEMDGDFAEMLEAVSGLDLRDFLEMDGELR